MPQLTQPQKPLPTVPTPALLPASALAHKQQTAFIITSLYQLIPSLSGTQNTRLSACLTLFIPSLSQIYFILSCFHSPLAFQFLGTSVCVPALRESLARITRTESTTHFHFTAGERNTETV